MFGWLPEKDHPVWKVLQSLASLALVLITIHHGTDGGHTGGVDATDVGGVLGFGVGTKLLIQRVLSR